MSQTPPAQQPQPALARAANAAFAEGMQASLARMLAELAAAGVFERPPQVFQHGDAIPRKAQHCSARPLHGALLCLKASNYHLYTFISRQAPFPRLENNLLAMHVYLMMLAPIRALQIWRMRCAGAGASSAHGVPGHAYRATASGRARAWARRALSSAPAPA